MMLSGMVFRNLWMIWLLLMIARCGLVTKIAK